MKKAGNSSDMNAELLVLEFSDDSMRSKVFEYADVPARWDEGDAIADLNSCDILEICEATACYVERSTFEDGGPGTSDCYYKVYTRDAKAFRSKLALALIALLERESKRH